MNYLSKVLTTSAFCAIASVALASPATITVRNDTICHVNANGSTITAKKEKSSIPLYSFNADGSQYGSINPQGRAPLMKDSSGTMDVAIGDGSTPITESGPAKDGNYIVYATMSGKDSACTTASPCYIASDTDPCASQTAMLGGAYNLHQFKKMHF
ncbi:MAG: hypothetical protein K0U29_02880 [Gammaproteobacteria bacterium]|nr:hypothetical protein [Gammaproteobacteria bacterium]MCH9743855.1 hypothetical protein [Gammaproteobacteria bacterium]